MNVTINILELASELADKELNKIWDYRDGYINIQDGNDCFIYTEIAQNIFNGLYDKYYTIIEKSQV